MFGLIEIKWENHCKIFFRCFHKNNSKQLVLLFLGAKGLASKFKIQDGPFDLMIFLSILSICHSSSCRFDQMLASYSLPFDTRIAVNPFNPNIATATKSKFVSTRKRQKEEKRESIETEKERLFVGFQDYINCLYSFHLLSALLVRLAMFITFRPLHT